MKNKVAIIIGAIIIGIFIALGILTVCIDPEDKSSSNEDTENVEEKDKDKDKDDDDEGYNITMPSDKDPYVELNELIGLDSVKSEVKTLANFVKVQQQRKKQGLKTPSLSYHLVFTGSPGTGKTTVARIIARIYKDLGILKKGQTVETDRSGLVAAYVGQTAIKTNKIIDKAIGGVLFIDEAYALVPEEDSQDYGQEAISTLLKRMEDDRDSLVVIIAGYQNEMKRFIDSNPGLQSRFNRYISFPDYSSDELYQILCMYLNKNEYKMTKDAADYARERLNYAVAHKDKNFGNARFVRNVFEKTIQKQANRVAKIKNATATDLTLIKIEDLKAAF